MIIKHEFENYFKNLLKICLILQVLTNFLKHKLNKMIIFNLMRFYKFINFLYFIRKTVLLKNILSIFI